MEFPDPFNQELSKNKAIHIYFAQAVPLVSYIDEESCLYLKENKCRICELVCDNEAIDFSQKPKRITVKVGAVVLSPGFEPYDPSLSSKYKYGIFQNVLTSIDFERLTCATGPYGGEMLRPSDKKHPRKIAWIQCVGSRSVSEEDNSYCSAVCCTYTQKQVILAKEHDPDVECTVFHNDIRSYGKDFEPYFNMASNLPGVRFIRSYVSIEREDPKTKNVIIRYSTPEGVKEEEFDLVILSVGLSPPKDAKEIAEKFGVELNEHGFCKVNPENPIKTSREGVFVTGAFQGPADIPESVISASGAEALCGELLYYRRGKLAKEKEYPPEKDVTGKEPRVGVFVCHCGANIASVVDVPSVVEYASKLPYVVHSQEQLFSCTDGAIKEIIETVKEKDLNRVVIAACTPRNLEMLFRNSMREAGLNQYLLEMTNIREQCSWVHSREKEEATEKAKDLVRMAVARACNLEPLEEIELPVDKRTLIVGGGIAGMTCALSIANQGYEVYIVEKEKDLGGISNRLQRTLEGLDVQSYLSKIKREVYSHPLIHVILEGEIFEVTGYIGNFLTKVKTKDRVVEIKHGATVIAAGAEEYKPEEYLYGKNANVITQLELEEKIAKDAGFTKELKNVVMIQCVGCRNDERNYCSRICCSQAIKNAIKLKEANPEADVYILYRDMRTYGFYEDYYRKASDMGVKFIRYEPPENVPEVQEVQEGGKKLLRVTVGDPVLGAKLSIDADMVVLSAAVVPPRDAKKLAEMYKLTIGPDGFFKEVHVKLRPVEFSTDGVYLCGMAHYPKHIRETINQALGAAGRVLALITHDTVTASGAVCTVDEKKCMGCGSCVEVCAYGAIELREEKRRKKALVNPVLCKGCGLCNAKCPTGAISLKHFTDEEIECQIDAIFEEEAIGGEKYGLSA